MKKVLSLILIASLAFTGLASADENASEAPHETAPAKMTAAPTVVAATK